MADVTFYPDYETIRGSLDAFRSDANAKTESHDFLVKFGDRNGAQRTIACSCYAGKRWSVTARDMNRDATRMGLTLEPISPDRSHQKIAEKLEVWPADRVEKESNEKRQQRERNSEHVQKIWELAERGARGTVRHGIIVIAGATGSRKTTYAREISRQYIGGLLGPDRERPHIVTYEDPIESWFAYSPEDASAGGFEYTPRQKAIDVRSLDHAVTDALRQKPALLYVNEIRGEPDWRALLDFAGTGHLAITTTHAGSLVEAFERILDAAGADTPEERRRIASRIVAVVHLRLFGDHVIPSLWVQSPPALTALTQDGLSSLLPSGKEGPCIGRRYFAEEFRLGETMINEALRSDLNGE